MMDEEIRQAVSEVREMKQMCGNINMKYILEIKPEYEANGIMILGARDSHLYVTTLEVKDLEELNSDYINEHYPNLQDTAYKKGLHDGESKCRYCNEYQRGLEDAWECARELCLNGACKDMFGEYFNTFIKNHTAQEAIEKLKAYKQNDKIEVGDEVIYNGTTKCIVVRPEDDERFASLIDGDGTHYCADHRECKKTGRHFDIASILKEMQS